MGPDLPKRTYDLVFCQWDISGGMLVGVSSCYSKVAPYRRNLSTENLSELQKSMTLCSLCRNLAATIGDYMPRGAIIFATCRGTINVEIRGAKVVIKPSWYVLPTIGTIIAVEVL
jgi:hypothetical protein